VEVRSLATAQDSAPALITVKAAGTEESFQRSAVSFQPHQGGATQAGAKMQVCGARRQFDS